MVQASMINRRHFLRCALTGASWELFRASTKFGQQTTVRHVTTFAVWVDVEYKERFGDLGFIAEYGEGMRPR